MLFLLQRAPGVALSLHDRLRTRRAAPAKPAAAAAIAASTNELQPVA
jgi:hypothetical protein